MRFIFSPSIDERNWHVYRPIIKLGEFQGQFFFYVDRADMSERSLVAPPRGLYGKEFLELDYRNPFELMAFQQKWGPITGLRARPNVTFDYESHIDVDCLGGITSQSIPSGAQETIFLFKGYGDGDTIATERYGTHVKTLGDIVNDHYQLSIRSKNPSEIVPCHIATLDEVAEAVCHAQIAITAITDCLKDDFTEDMWQRRKPLVNESLRYCNTVVQSAVRSLDIIEDNDTFGVCTIMQYMFICMIRGVMRNETYRICQNPNCRRLFTPAECGRRADAKYCSEDCQNKAKYLRTQKTRRPKKTIADPASAGENQLVLDWSVSGYPAQVFDNSPAQSPLASLLFSFLDCGDLQDEHLIRMYGLNIPNPSAQHMLNERVALL